MENAPVHHPFDDIRPYLPAEIPAAMQRIAEDEHFARLARYSFPDACVEDIRQRVRNIRTTDEFQQEIMYPVNRQIITRSIARLTCSGLDRLDKSKRYLFVSNHRDIMLDSSLLQFFLHSGGFRTTEITFGSNLMYSQLAIDIGKSNKMFTVIRSSNMRTFLENSLHLSAYIRHTIREKGESVWIAQRNGRTKDGNDCTDRGIIKMFCMSKPTDPPQAAISELNIVPVAVSYQIESCDMLKVRELYLSRQGRKYIKQPGEDLNSILTGILQPKGDVHIGIGKPLTPADLHINCKFPNEFYREIAARLDTRIREQYQCHDNNYIAHDIRSGTARYGARYTPEAKERFLDRCNRMLAQTDGDRDTLRALFLGIYAAPVDNTEKITHT
jgi:hypothetical protein